MMISVRIIFFLCCLPNLIYSSVPFVLYPDCDVAQCKEYGHPVLYYANHPIGDDKVHIFYSTFDELTISILQTKNTDSPTFNYTALFSRNYTGAIQFADTKPNNSLTLVLRRVIEFNDTDDKGVMDVNDQTMNSYFLTNLPSNNITFSNNNTNQPSFQFPLDQWNGSLTVDVIYPGQTTRESKFPKLQTDSSSYFLNIALQATQLFKTSRFAFELYLISPGKENLGISSSKYIDDQYTPGIFQVWQMKTSDSSLYPSSMLWKPVVYQSEDRTIEDNTLMQIYSLKNNVTLDHDIDQGIFYSILSSPYTAGFNVSLGQSADGFFSKTNYGFIQFTAGLNILKPDSTVVFVTVGLIVSLALPALVAIIALIVILKRRFSQQSSSSYNTLVN